MSKPRIDYQAWLATCTLVGTVEPEDIYWYRQAKQQTKSSGALLTSSIRTLCVTTTAVHLEHRVVLVVPPEENIQPFWDYLNKMLRTQKLLNPQPESPQYVAYAFKK